MPDPNLQPSDFIPAFSWSRLIAVATILVKARRWVAAEAKPDRGDTRTGIGFRAWEHGKHAITVAAAGEHGAWLGVRDGSAKFLFMLGGAPIRFYRGDSDEPVPENYADPNAIERLQLQLFRSNNGSSADFDGYWRIIVQADAAGFPLGAFMAAVSFDNIIRMAWPIPLSGEAGGATPIVVPQSPVPLPPLVVLTVAEEETAAREAAERERQEREARARAEESKINPITDIKGA